MSRLAFLDSGLLSLVPFMDIPPSSLWVQSHLSSQHYSPLPGSLPGSTRPSCLADGPVTSVPCDPRSRPTSLSHAPLQPFSRVCVGGDTHVVNYEAGCGLSSKIAPVHQAIAEIFASDLRTPPLG